MPTRDFQMPDDFPDLRISEKNDQPAQPPLSPLAPPRPSWREGDRVLAPWEPNFLYVGNIAQIKGDQVLIQFDDGDSGWVALGQVQPLTLKVGQKVQSRRNMGHQFGPVRILEIRGDQVHVQFEDAPGDEWTRLGALRVPCRAQSRGAAPTKVASHLAFLEKLQAGDRVWAPWHQATLFAGTVDQIDGREAHIHFDDGDRGWVQLEQLVPLQIMAGLRVVGRWKMGSQFYPGTVTQVEGERIHIQYDNGNREWTRSAALMIPCQPLGPAARPTRNAGLAGSAWTGWVVALVIVAVVLFLVFGGVK